MLAVNTRLAASVKEHRESSGEIEKFDPLIDARWKGPEHMAAEDLGE